VTAPTTFFFMHIMKTGGTSLLGHAWRLFGRYGVEPPLLNDDPQPPGTSSDYQSVARVRDLPASRRAEVRFYAGHYPFLVRDIIEPDVTLTVLREPVARTISVLRQLQAGHARVGGRTLEEIYDDEWLQATSIRNFQVRQFALTHADLEEKAALVAAFRGDGRPTLPDKPHLFGLAIDEQRLELAKANLAQVDEIGLQADFAGFLARLRARFGWAVDDDVRLRAAPAGDAVSPELRARIVEDLRWDTAFYEHAVEVCAERASAS
jgi:hypothetical protein